ncbi:CLUMA_CG006473, isoform A [Clunio marinus]|uniref:CLUMA_CG006473, isoform A n=1 Tax=Clunio marinus TaxID=568069 RepID=A0A1J1HZR3_9DIPT|nr:CLUMA_CG006473, isoform A [Clunio marinus]
MENENIESSNETFKLQEQFNAQRARMKELYMQKEKECSHLKQKVLSLKKDIEDKDSQLVIAEYNRQKDLEDQIENSQQEIQTLQQLLQETCDEATLANNEISRLTDENEKFRLEIGSLRENLIQYQQDSNKSLESLLGLKTLARNVKKITGANSNSQESLDESIRKVAVTPSSKYAQEDAETLRSLVLPLEDEIQQLKEKLRSAYDEIEQTKGSNLKTQSAVVGLLGEAQKEKLSNEIEPENNACSMCQNYELQLVKAQEELESERQKKFKVEKIIERLKQDLIKESDLRSELEKTWQEKREEHKEEVQKLCDLLNRSERCVLELQNEFSSFKEEIYHELIRVSDERQEIHEHLETLQRDNDYLSGRYLQHSNELKEQEIDLPQNIEELHELVLRLNEHLIVSKSGQEFNEAKCISFRDEANLLRDQLQRKEKEKEFLEQKLNHRMHNLEDKLKQQHQIHQKMLSEKEDQQKVENENKKEISELRMQNIELSETVDKMEKSNMDLKSKVAMMQQELTTSEAVQKDFVKLSQSLQMQLEKIRSADSQVRWQDEEDCYKCPTCKQNFTVTRRKINCRHCGTIFCESCCSKVVKSGVSGRTAKVCEVCYTLLEQNSAPFFSQAPHTP